MQNATKHKENAPKGLPSSILRDHEPNEAYIDQSWITFEHIQNHNKKEIQ